MRTLASSLRADSVVGQEIILPWHKLNTHLSFHTKELVLVAAAPSAGKSVFAVNLALNITEPVLYIAQDSPASVLARMTALDLGVTINEAFDRIRDDADEVAADIEGKHPLLALETGACDLDRIDQLVWAATEWLGRSPAIVILDNLINTTVPGHHHQDIGFYATALPRFQQLALAEDLCFIALHHVTRRGNDAGRNVQGLGTRRLNMTDLLYSGEREAEHVLGIYHDQQKTKLNIQILKQRDGDADPEGETEVSLRWHPSLGRLAAWG
jgi:hypothetical protein